MAKKCHSAATTRKPLTISIHGPGIDVDAVIEDAPGLSAGFKAAAASIIEQLAARSVDTPSPGAPIVEEHDFDAVECVIKHGDVGILQAILELATNELEMRRAAS